MLENPMVIAFLTIKMFQFVTPSLCMQTIKMPHGYAHILAYPCINEICFLKFRLKTPLEES